MRTNFNIENTDTIDTLAYREQTKMMILQIADGMDWSDMERHFSLLREKLDTYIWYIDSKQYEDKYPDVERIELRVTFLFKEPDDLLLCQCMGFIGILPEDLQYEHIEHFLIACRVHFIPFLISVLT